jgi:hypothetical protein
MTNENSISDSLNRLNLVTTDYNRGFTMTFANRVTVSVRWGKYSNSDGKTTAEVAAWDADTHEWVRVTGYDYDNVLGHLTTNEIVKFMCAASTMPSAVRSNA